MDREQLARIISSMKGIAGSGNVLSHVVSRFENIVATMDPGDYVAKDTASAAPVATDLWYLWYHDNVLQKFYSEDTSADFRHYDYSAYLSDNLSFLNRLEGLKPLKVLTDLSQLSTDVSQDVFGKLYSAEYQNNGIYWINTMAFELWNNGVNVQYGSDGPKDFKPNDYVGYLTFPVGQLGVMEVISLLQETVLSGYQFAAVDSDGIHLPKPAPEIKDDEKPAVQFVPEIFPDAKNSNGNQLSGMNYCYGLHLIEDAYRNVQPRDLELFSAHPEPYEDVKPKFWMRYWIHKQSTLPVPGEFVGILARPVATPPHVWWFQESSPFLYAGNWMETGNLTSGVIVSVTLAANRTDGGIGDEYQVKIQGCTVTVYSTDFLSYSAGDRVAILKVDSTTTAQTKSFTWDNQDSFLQSEKNTVIADYVIVPFTFYKI